MSRKGIALGFALVRADPSESCRVLSPLHSESSSARAATPFCIDWLIQAAQLRTSSSGPVRSCRRHTAQTEPYRSGTAPARWLADET